MFLVQSFDSVVRWVELRTLQRKQWRSRDLWLQFVDTMASFQTSLTLMCKCAIVQVRGRSGSECEKMLQQLKNEIQDGYRRGTIDKWCEKLRFLEKQIKSSTYYSRNNKGNERMMSKHGCLNGGYRLPKHTNITHPIWSSKRSWTMNLNERWSWTHRNVHMIIAIAI